MRAKMTPVKRTALILLAATSLVVFAQQDGAAGRWEGAILVPGSELKISVDLRRAADGAWVGAIDIPTQGLTGFQLSDVAADDGVVSFLMKAVPGEPTFKGKLAEDGRAINGGFRQGDASFPFHLARSSEHPEPGRAEKRPEIVGIPGEGLGGIWYGVLDAGAMKLRLVAEISEAEDGTLSGALDSVDQGAELQMSTVKLDGKAVHFELAQPPAAFDGTLSDIGAEIEGEWKQGGRSLPLVFKRQEKLPDTGRSQDPQKPYPYDEKEVGFDNSKAGVRFAGTVTLPTSKDPFPAVMLISGSGAQDRNETVMGHRPFLVLADYLTRRGVAVLRVDDRGVGGSTGDIETATTADFAGDVLAGVEFLKRQPRIDPARIGLVGHSEGALVAPLAASQSKDVAFIVLLAAPGLRGQELLHLQSAVLMKAMGLDQETIDLNRGVQEKIFSIVNEEADDAAAEKKLMAMQQEQFASLSEQERKALGVADDSVMSSQAKMLLNRWFRYFLSYDPAPALEKVKCPVLVMSGERDLQVPPRENLPLIEKALKSGGNASVRIVELPGLNHLLQNATTGLPSEYAEIDETIAPAALEIIGNWIANQRRASGLTASPPEN